MRLNRMKFAVVCAMLFSMTTGISVFAQSLDLKGVWVLDSVQVKEIMPDNIVEKTVQPNERALLDACWMKRFKLDSEGKASYTDVGFGILPAGRPYFFTGVPYEIKDIAGNTATLIIRGVPDNKILNIRLLSDSSLLISHSFTTRMTGYSNDVEIAWKMYYRRYTE